MKNEKFATEFGFCGFCVVASVANRWTLIWRKYSFFFIYYYYIFFLVPIHHIIFMIGEWEINDIGFDVILRADMEMCRIVKWIGIIVSEQKLCKHRTFEKRYIIYRFSFPDMRFHQLTFIKLRGISIFVQVYRTK